MTVFRLPDLGEGLQEAEIVAWHVSPGDHVVADQPLVSVETAKAVVEIPAPQSGRIAKLHGAAGDVVAVGSPLVEFDGGSAGESEAIVGELPHEAPAAKARTRKAALNRTDTVRAAPAARRLAGELGIDLQTVTGTGPDGTILKQDVEQAAGAARPSDGEPLRGTRRAMAQAMAKAGAEIVPATVTDEADISAWHGRDDPTVRLLIAMVAACRAEPALNAWYDASKERRILHDHADIGIAVDTGAGLFVPVLRQADTLDTKQLRAAVDRLKREVQDRSVPATELAGQTITLSNFGTMAGRHASLVIMPPQVAILGAGRIGDQIVAIDSAPAVRQVLPLSLTFDHRVVTGGEAARFLAAVIASLETENGNA